MLDTLRADYVSAYGYPRETTPFLDELAERGVLFEQVYSQETSTLHSARSYFTGKYPDNLNGANVFTGIGADEDSLITLFNRAGFETAVFSGNPWIEQRFGFFRGADEAGTYLHTELSDTSDLGELFSRYFRDDSATNALLSDFEVWLEQTRDQAWLGYLHILRPHNPYFTDAAYREAFVAVSEEELGEEDLDSYLRSIEFEAAARSYEASRSNWAEPVHMEERKREILRDLYAANTKHADDIVRHIVRLVEQNGNLDDTLIVIVSDHGENFGKFGRYMHGFEPFREQVRVPLIVAGPSTFFEHGHRVETPVELIDLLPTLADAFGLSQPENIQGRSLVPALLGKPIPQKRFYRAHSGSVNTVMIRADTVKLIATFAQGATPTITEWKLFDLESDPTESFDISREEDWRDAPVVLELKQEARRYYMSLTGLAEGGELPEMSPEQEEALRALGYIE